MVPKKRGSLKNLAQSRNRDRSRVMLCLRVGTFLSTGLGSRGFVVFSFRLVFMIPIFQSSWVQPIELI